MVAKFGGICTGKENFPLVDKDDCMRASKSLSKKFSEQDSANHPRGCYLLLHGDVTWNNHETGKIRGDCAAICRKPRNDL